MERRHRPYRPYAPPRGEPDGWVVAGAEPGDRPPARPNGQDPPAGPRYAPPAEPAGWYATPYDPGYGGLRYGESPAPGYPDPGYPPDPGAPEPYPPEPYPPAPALPPPGTPPTAAPPPTAGPYRAARSPHSRPPLRPPAEPDPGGPPPAAAWTPALLWTVGLFLVPVLAYLGWALSLDGAAPAGCVDAIGAACPPPRIEAVRQLVEIVPALAGALTLSLVVALGIRRVAGDWHGFTVGFAAAVIGAGLTTLVAAIVG